MFRNAMLYFVLILMMLTMNATEKKDDLQILGIHPLAVILQFLDERSLQYFRNTSKFYYINFEELKRRARVAALSSSDAYLYQQIFDEGISFYCPKQPNERGTFMKEVWQSKVNLLTYGKNDFQLGVRGHGYMEFAESEIIEEPLSIHDLHVFDWVTVISEFKAHVFDDGIKNIEEGSTPYLVKEIVEHGDTHFVIIGLCKNIEHDQGRKDGDIAIEEHNMQHIRKVKDIVHRWKIWHDNGTCAILHNPMKRIGSKTTSTAEEKFESDEDNDIKITFKPVKNEIFFNFKNEQIGVLEKPISFKMVTEIHNIGFFFKKDHQD